MADLEALLQRLIAHDVEFVIVGGYAAVVHGVTLVTQDVDLCCRFSPPNLLALQAAVADLHPVHRMTPQRRPLDLNEQNCRGLKNLYVGTDLGVIDCISEVRGVGDYETVSRGCLVLDLGFGECRVLNLEALIRAKEAMGRERDLQAIIQLRAIRARQGN